MQDSRLDSNLQCPLGRRDYQNLLTWRFLFLRLFLPTKALPLRNKYLLYEKKLDGNWVIIGDIDARLASKFRGENLYLAGECLAVHWT